MKAIQSTSLFLVILGGLMFASPAAFSETGWACKAQSKGSAQLYGGEGLYKNAASAKALTLCRQHSGDAAGCVIVNCTIIQR